jgi:DNA-binding XRE family transcriptional regulator
MDQLMLRTIRREMGLTQLEVAKELMVDKQTISRWERRENRIPEAKWRELLTLRNSGDAVREIKRIRKSRVRGRPFEKRS